LTLTSGPHPSLVKAILEQNAIAAELNPESRLVDVGLTSMDMVNLMLSVEAEFDSRFRRIRSRRKFPVGQTLELMIVHQLRSEQAA